MVASQIFASRYWVCRCALAGFCFCGPLLFVLSGRVGFPVDACENQQLVRA